MFSRALLALAFASAISATAYAGPLSLSKDEVDGRAREYYERGLEQSARNELRPALDSFRMARAYDAAGRIVELPDLIERTEARLKAGSPTANAPRGPAIVGVAPTAPTPLAEERFQTFRSRLYPYSIELPESWSAQSGGTKVGNAEGDLLQAPRGHGFRPTLTVVAHLLPPDIDARAYLEVNLKNIRAQGMNPERVGDRQVDGMAAWLVRTRVANEQGAFISTLAVFGRDRVGWTATFSAAPDESDRLQPLFQRMLDGLKVGALTTA